MPGSFFDTDVLIYLAADPQKAARVRELLNLGGTINVQILNEIANVARRKMRYSWERTQNLLAQVRQVLEVMSVTLAVHENGLRLAARYQLSIYDGMIAAAALASSCDVLWSEDMHDGLVIDGRLTVVNPFRTAS